MLNFDKLPTNAPESNGGFELLQPGWDTFTIERADESSFASSPIISRGHVQLREYST